jgi:general secretion pathway protein D
MRVASCSGAAGLALILAGPAAAQVPMPWITSQLPVAGVRPPFAVVPSVAAPAVMAPETTAGLLASDSEVFEIVRLRYADVSEVAGLLTGAQTVRPNDSFTPEEPAFGSASLQGGYAAAAGFATVSAGPAMQFQATAAEPLGRALSDSIGVDRRLNAIVLKGPAPLVGRLKAQIAKLDVPLTSVVLETVFVELTETGARNLGFDFGNANGQLATINYAYSRGDFPGAGNTARGGGVAANLQAALYAQIDKGEGRIISKPRIAAQSGGTAKIVTGDALPILTSIALSGVNAVQQQVQYVNVGVTLQIAPRVGDDGVVTSHVFAVVSSVAGFSQGYPSISQREASTSATVRDGESFVIGGLTQEAELTHRIKVPGLGEIPVLGRLFDSRHDSRAKTDLYVVVTPRVVPALRPAEVAAAAPAALAWNFLIGPSSGR